MNAAQAAALRYQQQQAQQMQMHSMHYGQMHAQPQMQYRHPHMVAHPQYSQQAPAQQQAAVQQSHREAQHLMHQKLLALNEQSWVLLGILVILNSILLLILS